ncbi:MAG: hypothetical protein ACJA0N_002357 [Pseudohongiellaceae bacterium]
MCVVFTDIDAPGPVLGKPNPLFIYGRRLIADPL